MIESSSLRLSLLVFRSFFVKPFVSASFRVLHYILGMISRAAAKGPQYRSKGLICNVHDSSCPVIGCLEREKHSMGMSLQERHKVKMSFLEFVCCMRPSVVVTASH